jgi:hypothetical protein
MLQTSFMCLPGSTVSKPTPAKHTCQSSRVAPGRGKQRIRVDIAIESAIVNSRGRLACARWDRSSG